MTQNKTIDIVIIGGGIVGMATAMELSRKSGRSLVVVEAENRLAAHQTGNNSGVIHSGIYYKPGSLKAENCTIGREQLYTFCETHGIPAERCGKVVVVTRENEIELLNNLKERGIANGLKGLKSLSAEEIKEYEPHVDGLAGLFVPDTGIVNYTRVTEKFSEIFLNNGGEIKLNTRIRKMEKVKSEIILHAREEVIKCKNLINCAGLQSDRVARMCGIDPGLKIIPFRGEYYELLKEKEYLVKNLIYPVPDPQFPFLGVHFTRMIDGGVEAGPNAVLALKREGYKKTSISLRDLGEILLYPGFWKMISKHMVMGIKEQYRSLVKASFVKTMQRLIPEITIRDVAAGGSGVRAQALEPSGFLVDDFRIKEAEHMVHVLNAPSPAATAAINIGKTIAKIARDNFNL